jgi:hypothetical protein
LLSVVLTLAFPSTVLARPFCCSLVSKSLNP